VHRQSLINPDFQDQAPARITLAGAWFYICGIKGNINCEIIAMINIISDKPQIP
jgi:hypothetical protein